MNLSILFLLEVGAYITVILFKLIKNIKTKFSVNDVLALFQWYFYLICSTIIFHNVHFEKIWQGYLKDFKLAHCVFCGYYVLVSFIELNYKIILCHIISFVIFTSNMDVIVVGLSFISFNFFPILSVVFP